MQNLNRALPLFEKQLFDFIDGAATAAVKDQQAADGAHALGEDPAG
jgi:hypothetical protein